MANFQPTFEKPLYWSIEPPVFSIHSPRPHNTTPRWLHPGKICSGPDSEAGSILLCVQCGLGDETGLFPGRRLKLIQMNNCVCGMKKKY